MRDFIIIFLMLPNMKRANRYNGKLQNNFVSQRARQASVVRFDVQLIHFTIFNDH